MPEKTIEDYKSQDALPDIPLMGRRGMAVAGSNPFDEDDKKINELKADPGEIINRLKEDDLLDEKTALQRRLINSTRAYTESLRNAHNN